jgi:monovalent cation:H+ antiporter-2, CPA2 family
MQADFKVAWILAIGLSAACLFGYIAQRLKISPIIGYLLAGFLIGPHFPGFVADLYISEQLAYIGVTLLMFVVGMRFSWKDIISVKKIVLPGALILAFISICLGLLLSISLGLRVNAGIIIGGAICVSSTVVIVRMLTDLNLLHTFQGHIVIGWTIIEDLIAIFILVSLPVLTRPFPTDRGSLFGIAYAVVIILLKFLGLAVIVYFIGVKIVQYILTRIARTRSHELFTLAILSLVFMIAIGSSYIFGVSLALGAFIAGTVVGKTDVSHQAAANTLPMRDAFSVIFFLSVGMLFNPMALRNNFLLFFGILGIVLLLRTSLAFVILRISRYPVAVATTVAIAIGQIGEYSFILAEEGNRLQILSNSSYEVLIGTALISIALNPLLFQLLKPVMEKPAMLGRSFEPSLTKEDMPMSQAIVVGYGPLGEIAVETLKEHEYKVLIIDQNVDVVSKLKEKGEEALFGDATQPQFLNQAGIEGAKMIVITTPDFLATKAIIMAAEQLNPYINVIARIRFLNDRKDEKLAGATVVCDEERTSNFLRETISNQIRDMQL